MMLVKLAATDFFKITNFSYGAITCFDDLAHKILLCGSSDIVDVFM